MTKLSKSLSLYGLTMIVIGACIGSGIFLTPSQIAGHLTLPSLIILVWIVGGVLSLTGALTYGELGGMFPKAGGVYVYLKEAYGTMAGFLFGWAYFTVINTGTIAALAIAFTNYFDFLFPMSASGELIVTIAAIIMVSVINIFRVKLVEMFTNIFTGLKLLGIIAIISIGFIWGTYSIMDGSTAEVQKSVLETNTWSSFGLALIGVLWSFSGWHHVSYLSGEAKNAKRNIPLAMIIGTLIVSVVYLLTNLSFMALLPISEIANSDSVAADAISSIMASGGVIIAVLIVISTFGTALINTMAAPRIYYVMAEDGVFFKGLAKIHAKYKTPANAIIAQALWSIIIVIIWGTFEAVITYVVFIDWIFFVLVACIVILFRFTRKDAIRPYKTIGYPIIPIIFIATATIFVGNTLINNPLYAGVGLLFLGLGLPVYYYFKKQKLN
ncbi:APC family permease [Flavivirga spongiicola]|uniref:Amino acid permease n=1 Tax=Flavivirga spongiicola TaxID=421621 RepID=A0ABU7XWS3_9FLAO|nr:amino acid permease [Flavivirga sp. MEBiC05379]MDO5980202.1 amino acid permease [Flavivirga sp. MEBiC05379]